jgi:uncharacterized protein (UPF0332 family)
MEWVMSEAERAIIIAMRNVQDAEQKYHDQRYDEAVAALEDALQYVNYAITYIKVGC